MRYYFIVEKNNNHTRHILTAKSIERAFEIAATSNITVDYVYELPPDTFKDEGFLISDMEIAANGN